MEVINWKKNITFFKHKNSNKTHNNISIWSRLKLNISTLILSDSETLYLKNAPNDSIVIKLAKAMFKDSDSANSMINNSYLQIINIIIKSK